MALGEDLSEGESVKENLKGGLPQILGEAIAKRHRMIPASLGKLVGSHENEPS